MEEGKKKKGNSLNASFVTGAIALVFLIIGYQVALFVHKAALTRIAANRDHPDTVYVVEYRSFAPDSTRDDQEGDKRMERKIVRKDAPHSPEVRALRGRQVECFPFNPNTASVEDLQRLGFSEKQAQAIDNYRQKGGRFRRKADFARSFVVADSVYARLEPFIEIPRIDINTADSTALLSLPGIGPFYAGKMIEYRERLHGYSSPEQLMEIWRFDREKYEGLSDIIICSSPEPYPLWTLAAEELARHPYISREEAHGIVLYRQHNPPEACTLEGLEKAGVISEEHAVRLSRCLISPPAGNP